MPMPMPLAMQSVEVRHWTQSIVVVSQTGV
jgi:hypothetical protein